MAKLCAYYNLCPLIDQKSLLGVAEDSTTGCVIVTLGRNIVIRYKLLNQKQISSWSSKEKLSSPVIFDNVGNQYYAMFNRTQLRMWTENDKNLDKVKKIKFQEQVHCILPQKNGEPLIIFNNGTVKPLSTALDTRKTQNDRSLLSSDEIIEDCHLVTHEDSSYVTLFSHHASVANYHIIALTKENTPVKLKLAREDISLMGQTTIPQSCQLLTLWSDGRLYSLPFLPHPCPEAPGNLVNVVSAVSTKHPVVMAPLSSSHIAMYGADPTEEGAALIIYNIQHGVIQSRHHFKLLASPPRLWCVSTNLLIAMTHSLVVVPFQLQAQRLSALVGALAMNATQPEPEPDPDLQEMHLIQSEPWETNKEAMDTSSVEEVPKSIQKQLQVLEADGYPQSMMLEKLVPQLLESKSVSELVWCTKHFIDIPENLLVKVLEFCLENISRDENEQYNQLLQAILSAPFSDVCMLPCLRATSFSQTLVLLKHLTEELESEEPGLELKHLLDWANLLLDAHYQQYILSGDTQVLDLMCRLREIVEQQVLHVNEMKGLLPLLQQLQEGKLAIMEPAVTNLYSIELLRLY